MKQILTSSIEEIVIFRSDDRDEKEEKKGEEGQSHRKHRIVTGANSPFRSHSLYSMFWAPVFFKELLFDDLFWRENDLVFEALALYLTNEWRHGNEHEREMKQT